MRRGGAGLTKKAVALTHRSIEAMKPELEPYRVPDARCAGLAVRVATDGAKTFDLAFRVKGGRSVRTSLGKFTDIGLDAARDRANELTKSARAGVDLLAEEKAAAAEKASRITTEQLIERYCKKKVHGKLRSAREIESRLKRALAPKLQTPAEDLKRRDLRDLIDETAEAGLLREAEKRRQTVGAMFRWAVSQDYLHADPTAGLTVYDPGTPRDRNLTDEEIRKLWVWLAQDTIPEAHSDVIKVQLALGARCGEVAGIMPDEIDLKEWTWTLPSCRSKNGRERVTPLVGLAREIIERRLPKAGPVFATETGKPLTASHVGQTLLKRRERLPIEHFTTHDLRRTFATALDSMGISIELIAAIVGHDSAVNRQAKTLVRHYLRTDKLKQKRAALESWDRRLRAILAGEDESIGHDNVAPLKRTA